MIVNGCGEEEIRSEYSAGTRVSFGGNENVLELNRGEDSIIL